MADSEKRQRTMTEKGEEQYEGTVAHMSARIEKRRVQLNEIASYVRGITTIDKLKDIHKQLLLVLGEYRLLIEDFVGYLVNQRTEKSVQKVDEVESLHSTFETVINSVLIEIELKMDNIESKSEHLHEHNSSPTEDNVAIQLSKFLVRKDLMLSRLMKFDDKPENYQMWKTSFKSVVEEVGVDSREELDLLVKWLGKDSVRHAINIRASSSPDPKASLCRLWERLDERYGSVEMLDAALRKKLERFPKLSPKDTYQLYELADLVEEIASHMENPQYKDLMTYYNTSIGIVPVVNKLPVYLQERWTVKAFEFKKKEHVLYPPFKYLSQFIREMSLMKNDPGFVYTDKVNKPAASTSVQNSKPVSTLKTSIDNPSERTCFYHNTTGHTLNECRTFKSKPITVRKKLLRDKGVCYKCCESLTHRANECPTSMVCASCGGNHASAVHVTNYGGEPSRNETNRNLSADSAKTNDIIKSQCTRVCGSDLLTGKSCAKVVLVTVYPKASPNRSRKMYALVDDQSNRTLARPEFFDLFEEKYQTAPYSLSSCAGVADCIGRRTIPDEFVISAIDGSGTMELPSITECSKIPDLHDEIPTPRAARAYQHLQDIADFIPEANRNIPVLLLIGRDLPEAHHVWAQRIGGRGQPFAQKLSLGWVLIGETCLGKVHQPTNEVNVFKTHVHHDGRPSIFPLCENQFLLKERANTTERLGENVVVRTVDDDKISLSQEDRDFLNIMNNQFVKTDSGHWSSPLPFRHEIIDLPNNREAALKRAHSLSRSLAKNAVKQKHFLDFMSKLLENGHAEIAPPLQPNEPCWYLPIFGVYQEKKPDQVRVVFDSSAQFQGKSLNSVLLQGPDLTNNMLGVLLRFRKDRVAVMADIQQMFFQFKVHEKDRNYLRFLRFEDNDPKKQLIEYRMCVHVFGNSPSPAIATFGLRKCVSYENVESAIKDFVNRDFYVDDGLASFSNAETAVHVVKSTQQTLLENGGLRLHKIASNDKNVLRAFNTEDLAKDLKNLAIDDHNLPSQRSLGLCWNLQNDSFSFSISQDNKALTRRGILSTVNSLFDPLGIIAPVVIQGKLIMRDILEETLDWDRPLSESIATEWQNWRNSLNDLVDVSIPRPYVPISCNGQKPGIYIFTDASEKAISAVAYMRTVGLDGDINVGFVMGKSKVAPKTGHTIPRLELCAAVIGVEIAEIISDQLGLCMDQMNFFSDSRVVLGYLNNRTRRFYVYVQNRISRILKSTNRNQWHYVPTHDNPADQGTRPVLASKLQESKWINGPECLKTEMLLDEPEYKLVSPEEDKEIRPQIKNLKVSTTEGASRHISFENISTWRGLIRVVSLLKRKIRTFKQRKSPEKTQIPHNIIKMDSEMFLIAESQNTSFKEEISALRENRTISKNSCIKNLQPWLDKQGLLRVGGRLKHAKDLPLDVKCPVILHRQHFITELIVTHYHEKVYHQGCHLTEGAIRSAGYWVVGCKRLVRSIISKCVKCRKLRGKTLCQLMADLPEDRLTPGPPFTFVGTDVFGPWNIITRRTRGSVSNNKRWCVLYTCLTSRAIHLELIEELSTSSFINATRRFIALRGPVKVFRSDRGTNFIGASKDLQANIINVEDGPMKGFLNENNITWQFNSPYSSHMGGVWERLIGVVRRILDSMLKEHMGNLSHEVLSTFMSEVSLIVNSRPLVSVSGDTDNPLVLSPIMLLTQKQPVKCEYRCDIGVKEMYRSHWKRVQCLSDIFWKRWKQEFLSSLQQRRKWSDRKRDIGVGDIVLLVEEDSPRISWPMGIVTDLYPSADGHIRKVAVKINRQGEDGPKIYTRPITKLVMLIECDV